MFFEVVPCVRQAPMFPVEQSPVVPVEVKGAHTLNEYVWS